MHYAFRNEVTKLINDKQKDVFRNEAVAPAPLLFQFPSVLYGLFRMFFFVKLFNFPYFYWIFLIVIYFLIINNEQIRVEDEETIWNTFVRKICWKWNELANWDNFCKNLSPDWSSAELRTRIRSFKFQTYYVMQCSSSAESTFRHSWSGSGILRISLGYTDFYYLLLDHPELRLSLFL